MTLAKLISDGTWNTIKSDNNNRIYIFDGEGKEVRIRGIPTSDADESSKFYTIIIENNTLKLVKDGKEVPFSFVPAGLMTLARLISDLLGDEIVYDTKGSAPERSPEGRTMKGGKKSRKKLKKIKVVKNQESKENLCVK